MVILIFVEETHNKMYILELVVTFLISNFHMLFNTVTLLLRFLI